MRKFDLIVLVIGAIGAIAWMIISNKDGFKANSATIIARSISIASTIDGQVENNPPQAGKRVSSNDLLVRILNGRFDRSRLVEFESHIAFLETEIASASTQQTELNSQLEKFERRAKSYSQWMLKEVALKRAESNAALEIAKQRQKLTANVVDRAAWLHQKKLASEANLQTARTEALVANNQVLLNEAQFQRNELLLKTLKRDGVFFENGDASYWDKTVDTLQVSVFDNANKISTLKAQLIKVKTQVEVEQQRMNSSFAEEHRAPFNGMVNATFVTKGTRVSSGTNLYQILDCTQPIIIIPIPDNRVSEFSVGLRVTVYPTDTKQELPGTISYVTSGALIGSNTSIQVQQDLTLKGSRAVVILDDVNSLNDASQSCETERKAVVVIHTKSLFDKLAAWTGRESLQPAFLTSVTESEAAEPAKADGALFMN